MSMRIIIYNNLLKSKDRIGGTLKTEVYGFEGGIFRAYSYYKMDKEEEIIGVGESDNETSAVKLSRKNLRNEWKAFISVNHCLL